MKKSLPLFFAAIAAVLCIDAFAKPIIIAVAPPNPEVVMPPPGYIACHTKPAEYVHGVWINQRQVCDYRGPRRTAVWTSGYWQCNHLKHHSVCQKWTWIPSRLDVYGGFAAGTTRVIVQPPMPPSTVIVRPAPPQSNVVVVPVPPPPPVVSSAPRYIVTPPPASTVVIR